jgi:CBS domain-containing protein
MRIEEIMTKDVVTCTPEDTLAAAGVSMWENDCGALPVVDPKSGEVTGMITDRDICIAVATKGKTADEIRVGHLVSGEVLSCRPEADVGTAHDVMRGSQVRRVPVLDDSQHVVGIVSLNDLALRAFEKGAGERMKKEVAETLAHVCRPAEAARKV